MEQILRYLLDMLPFMLGALPSIVVFRLLRVAALKRRHVRTTWQHEVFLSLFLIFLIGLASLTIAPKGGFVAGGLDLARINLIPLQVFFDTYQEVFEHGRPNYFLINFLGNIAMFMPVGFFIPLLWRKGSLRKVLLIACLCSLLIETCQLPQTRGSDVDDLWLNTLGAGCGYAVYLLAGKIMPRFIANCKVFTAHGYRITPSQSPF